MPGFERREWRKLLGISFQEDLCNWNLHYDIGSLPTVYSKRIQV